MAKLKDKVAIITGGSRGIGKTTVDKFLHEGARVAIWDIDETSGKSLVEEYKKSGKEVRFYVVNTVDFDAVKEATEKVVADFGGIDILINNAGITRDASMKKMTTEQWQAVIDVNLTGVFNCTKNVFPYMVERGSGRILNASSIVGLYGNFGQSNYVATKAGLIGLTKTWAREFGRKGITVNAIAPGFINTEMIQTIPEEIINNIKKGIPMARLGEPEDIANAYAFLASDEASYISGTVLSVDGGLVQ
ncbi:MAG: 3-oxoacyl-ACP reductase FabG [Bacteroidetes bacterium]|nr:MAG: 3-oxoacyl-ACP reductase FabG [Bacteroidota bacterium]